MSPSPAWSSTADPQRFVFLDGKKKAMKDIRPTPAISSIIAGSHEFFIS
jgi:hypothetical protein